jgi:hypothetical protein
VPDSPPADLFDRGLFVVLAQPRTGSTFLCDLLDHHPAVACHDELFHRRWVGLNGTGYDDLKSLPQREAAPLAFLASVVARGLARPGVTRVGFKYFPEHEPAIAALLAERPSIPVVRLRRRSVLAQYASFRNALAARDWFGLEGKARRQRATFALADYLAFHERLEREEKAFARLLRGRAHLALSSASLRRPRTQARLQRFLGLEVLPLRSVRERQDSRRTLARFTNPLVAGCLGPLLRFRWSRRLAGRLLRRRRHAARRA